MKVICKSSLVTKTQQRLKKDNNNKIFDVLNNILPDNNKHELIRIDSN